MISTLASVMSSFYVVCERGTANVRLKSTIPEHRFFVAHPNAFSQVVFPATAASTTPTVSLPTPSNAGTTPALSATATGGLPTAAVAAATSVIAPSTDYASDTFAPNIASTVNAARPYTNHKRKVRP